MGISTHEFFILLQGGEKLEEFELLSSDLFPMLVVDETFLQSKVKIIISCKTFLHFSLIDLWTSTKISVQTFHTISTKLKRPIWW